MRFTVLIGSLFAALAIAAPTPIEAEGAVAVDKRCVAGYTCSNIENDKERARTSPRPGSDPFPPSPGTPMD
ncbi:hypothetical protein MCOR27_006060 [Pyricularia oryzae]|uniref:Uncharacterized protein n=4 Tax=Pyricularia TaxID=48558 RepID=A0ABQ8NB81_PYRGI|nr:uncharacterized protein MGG_17239 [Pyricularia oryzae 70-15]ELQ40807.1 hypothetical protein OOU_Y34scaffold00351g2 [Pyricularia oryzae Y34]KAH8843116.1 hypothetical protein MCOR01_003942 [Pyricularia oryzae]KAI6294306.1 hypothetical protein MCOR33_008551 [Pyricularia grisea]EHA51145.1 hypothetical protein MGG_17239 [Pyricularia oryzae 70-15]KAI6254261.1 hypothetical protein MCOR19_009208 [Pyricularia oryzae]